MTAVRPGVGVDCLAVRFRSTVVNFNEELTIGHAQSCYHDKDILVPGFDNAMELLRLVKKKLGVDCGPRNGSVVYIESGIGEKSGIDHDNLARSYDELIEK